MLAGRRDRGVGQRGDHDVDVRPAREAAVLRFVIGALHVVHARRNGDGAAQVGMVRRGAALGRHGKIGQRVESEVHLARGAAELVAVNVVEKIVGHRAAFEEAQEREARVDARGHEPGADLVAGLQHDAARFVVLDQNSLDGRVRSNLGACLARRIRDGVRDRAGAAATQAPRSERAVNLAHVMVEQHVGGARRSHAEKRADDSRR